MNDYIYTFEDCKAKIDWLSFTVKKMSFDNALMSFGLVPTMLEEANHIAHNGYNNVYRIIDTDIVIWESLEHLDTMGTHFSIPSSWLNWWFVYLEDFYQLDSYTTWINFFRYVLDNGVVSRIDCCADTDCRLVRGDAFLSPAYLYRMFEKGRMVSRATGKAVVKRNDGTIFKTTEAYIIGNKESGFTFYVGKRKSQICLRIYDKAKEKCDFATFCTRVELELKNKKAISFVLDMLEHNVQYAYNKYLTDYIRFEDCPVWARFEKLLARKEQECVKLSVLCNVKDDFESSKSTVTQRVTYFVKQSKSSINDMIRMYGLTRQDFHDILDMMFTDYQVDDDLFIDYTPQSIDLCLNELRNGSHSDIDYS